jgi:hypothetical protein
MRARGHHKQYALAVALGVKESRISRELDISLDWFLTGTGSIDQHKISPIVPGDTATRLRTALCRARASLTIESREHLIEFVDSIRETLR